MLQTFLFVAVPALVILTTALYFLQRASTEEQEMHRPPSAQTRPGRKSPTCTVFDDCTNQEALIPKPQDIESFSSGSNAADNRTRPSSRTHLNTFRGSAGGSTVTSRRSITHIGDCVVCYEEGSIVELYPCRHRSLCEDCATKIISRNRGICPLCRAKIQGFSNI